MKTQAEISEVCSFTCDEVFDYKSDVSHFITVKVCHL